MGDVVAVTKTCSGCGQALPASSFHRDRRSRDGLAGRCAACNRASVKAAQAKRRAAMGDAAWLEYQRQQTAKSRQNAEVRQRSNAYMRARRAALQRLADLHRREFEHLLAIELREVGHT